MLDVIIQLYEFLMNLFQAEWFWTVAAVIVALLGLIVQMRQENEISRANFVYNISNDFGNNERILRVYQWLEKCRRDNDKKSCFRSLQITRTIEGCEDNFLAIDTYVNHFEVVYVILRSVNIKNIDELFQQRFLSFMFNPYVQKEVLFLCFTSNENNFKLLKKWLTSIQTRNRFSCEAFLDYINFYTCGNYELTADTLANTRKHWPALCNIKVKNYLMNYVHYICNPLCLYGYYEFTKEKTEESRNLRIIRSSLNDRDAIIGLQNQIATSMEHPEWYSSATEDDIQTALKEPQNYACVQVCDDERLVAFAYIILNPSPEQDMNQDLKAHGLPYVEKDQCVLETVFVDPDYRGFGIQSTLIRILCSWAATLGKRQMIATVHPNNNYSADNFEKNGFSPATPKPISKYGSERNIFTKNLCHKDTQKTPDGTYTVYPYV